MWNLRGKNDINELICKTEIDPKILRKQRRIIYFSPGEMYKGKELKCRIKIKGVIRIDLPG